MEVSGYGPFLSPQRYSLRSRGLCLVTGRNDDFPTADSNGAGKTSLVMAPLWALTGTTDARPDSSRGLTVTDVVHHTQGEGEEGGEGRGRRKAGVGAMEARVRVEGWVNGEPFVVERTAGR